MPSSTEPRLLRRWHNQQAFSISIGPTLTLGHLRKNFLDYAQFMIAGGGKLLQGVNPFSVDRIVISRTIGLGRM